MLKLSVSNLKLFLWNDHKYGIFQPPYRKLSELKKIFSPEELRNLTLAGLEYENDESNETKRLRKGPYFKVKRKTARPSMYASKKNPVK